MSRMLTIFYSITGIIVYRTEESNCDTHTYSSTYSYLVTVVVELASEHPEPDA